jgi:uncharacterized protein YfiM (DUF2279 family)
LFKILIHSALFLIFINNQPCFSISTFNYPLGIHSPNSHIQLNKSTDSLYGKKQIVNFTAIGFTVGTHVMLYELWYKNYDQSPFHFYDDSKEWLQMDKAGHAFSAYYLGVMGYEASTWAGYSNKKAAWNGFIFSTLFMTPIEIFDGFSAEWGASISDFAANTFGSAMYLAQALTWEEQRIKLKYSFSRSPYAPLRPNMLGSGLHQEFLKDYNGQTYWMTFELKDLLKSESKYLPDWLGLSIGYGANGLIGAESNNMIVINGRFDYSYLARYRQYYFSPDINLVKLFKPKKRGWRMALTALSCLKFPLPAYEYNGLRQSNWHWIHF